MSKVVARFTDGHTIKGTTIDFSPGKDIFHVNVFNAPTGAKPIEIFTRNLKALFFVKDFLGDPKYVHLNECNPEHPAIGVKIMVEFKDGEVLVGTTTGYDSKRWGFFILPADDDSNNERCYVVVAAAKYIRIL
jgi:hypothetical protein